MPKSKPMKTAPLIAPTQAGSCSPMAIAIPVKTERAKNIALTTRMDQGEGALMGCREGEWTVGVETACHGQQVH
jgi:hypothetical protein